VVALGLEAEAEELLPGGEALGALGERAAGPPVLIRTASALLLEPLLQVELPPEPVECSGGGGRRRRRRR